MKIAHKDVVIPDHPVMKKAQTVAEALWEDHGREEGITITSSTCRQRLIQVKSKDYEHPLSDSGLIARFLQTSHVAPFFIFR